MTEAAGYLCICYAVIDLVADHTLAFDLCLLLSPNYKGISGRSSNDGLSNSLLLIDSLGRSFDGAHSFGVLKNVGNVVSIFLVSVYSDLEHYNPVCVPRKPEHVQATHSPVAFIADWNNVLNG